MEGFIKKIEILSIIKDKIGEDPYFNVFAVPLKISLAPHSKWIEFFESSYRDCVGFATATERPVGVRGNYISLAIRESDDLQEAVDAVKKAVEIANQKGDRFNAELKAKQKAIEEQEEKDAEFIKELKERADKIKI